MHSAARKTRFQARASLALASLSNRHGTRLFLSNSDLPQGPPSYKELQFSGVQQGSTIDARPG